MPLANSTLSARGRRAWNQRHPCRRRPAGFRRSSAEFRRGREGNGPGCRAIAKPRALMTKTREAGAIRRADCPHRPREVSRLFGVHGNIPFRAIAKPRASRPKRAKPRQSAARIAPPTGCLEFRGSSEHPAIPRPAPQANPRASRPKRARPRNSRTKSALRGGFCQFTEI